MISIRGLRFQYKGAKRLALDTINLDIADGDFVGIIGTSGAGKSTLTYALNGIVPHHFTGDFYGQVLVDGMDSVDSSPEQLSAKIGSVFQDIDAQMVASLVEDEMAFGLENFGVPRAEIGGRIDEALAMVGIGPLRYRMIRSLSGGEKQKVAIAAIVALRRPPATQSRTRQRRQRRRPATAHPPRRRRRQRRRHRRPPAA